MLEVVLSNRFKKDLKLAARRGLPLDELNTVVDWLAAGQALLPGVPHPARLAARLPCGRRCS